MFGLSKIKQVLQNHHQEKSKTGEEYDPSIPLHEVKYRVDLSVRYHRKREGFLSACDRATKACALISGTYAFHAIAAKTEGIWPIVIVAAFTLPSLLSLAFSLADSAKKHAELAQKFLQLDSEMASKDFWSITPDDISKWGAMVRAIEISEPPSLTYLTRICQNQIAEAAGQPDKIVKLNFFKKSLAHIFSFS